MTYDRRLRYCEDGLVFIEGLLSEEKLIEVEAAVADYIRYVLRLGDIPDVVYEPVGAAGGPRAIRNLWRMHIHSPYFRQLGHDPVIMETVEELLEGEAELTAVEVFAKPARVGSGVPYHQDNAFFSLDPPDVLTCWIALDESSRKNGCVYYAVGSHRFGLLPHQQGGSPSSGVAADLRELPSPLVEVPGVLRGGDAIFHHCQLLHRSEPNRSGAPRRALVIVYQGTKCRIVNRDYHED